MTRSLVASGRWSLKPGTLLLETIRAGIVVPKTSGRPRRVAAQDEWSPKPEVAQHRFYCIILYKSIFSNMETQMYKKKMQQYGDTNICRPNI